MFQCDECSSFGLVYKNFQAFKTHSFVLINEKRSHQLSRKHFLHEINDILNYTEIKRSSQISCVLNMFPTECETLKRNCFGFETVTIFFFGEEEWHKSFHFMLKNKQNEYNSRSFTCLSVFKACPLS